VSTNPFDDDEAMFFVVVNDQEQHSLWPAAIDVPAGWRVVFGADTRGHCLAHIDRSWTDMRPKTLREAMARP
jgi:MbtH protein